MYSPTQFFIKSLKVDDTRNDIQVILSRHEFRLILTEFIFTTYNIYVPASDLL